MGFLESFKNKGYFHQCTNEEALTLHLKDKKIVAYVGFDCTAKSLHVGNLMQIMILRLLQQHGHKPIVLIGGATTKIGDPTGKDAVRKYLSDEGISENIKGIKQSLAKFIKFGDAPSDAIMINNSEWLENLGYIEFLRDMGRLFSVNRMLSMDSVKLRLERQQSLTFLEFNYMLLQAYDFYHLHKNFSCNLQLGGSDQWGNIVTGIDLVKKITGNEVYGLTTPLLTTSSGAKMGKSENGAIWLNASELSPYDYFQYWRNTEDNDVIKFAELYGEFSENEMIDFKNLAQNNINEAKKKLAHKVTALCHGLSEADNSMETAVRVFEQGGRSDNLPSARLNSSLLEQGMPAYELFFQTDLAPTKGEARRLIRGGGARLNDIVINDENQLVSVSSFEGNSIKLSVGKKKHLLVKLI